MPFLLHLAWSLDSSKREAKDEFLPKHLPSLVPDTAGCSIWVLPLNTVCVHSLFLCFITITVDDSLCLFCFTYLQSFSRTETSPLSCRSHTSLWRQRYFKHTCSSLLSAVYGLPRNISVTVSLCYGWAVSHNTIVFEQRRQWNPWFKPVFHKVRLPHHQD